MQAAGKVAADTQAAGMVATAGTAVPQGILVASLAASLLEMGRRVCLVAWAAIVGADLEAAKLLPSACDDV